LRVEGRSRGCTKTSKNCYPPSTPDSEISPDLPLTRERYFHKAATRSDSVFHFAIADTEPDGWGCKVIARDHAKRRKAGQAGESVALTGQGRGGGNVGGRVGGV